MRRRAPEQEILLTVALKPRAMAPRVVALIEAIKQWPEVADVTATALRLMLITRANARGLIRPIRTL